MELYNITILSSVKLSNLRQEVARTKCLLFLGTANLLSTALFSKSTIGILNCGLL